MAIVALIPVVPVLVGVVGVATAAFSATISSSSWKAEPGRGPYQRTGEGIRLRRPSLGVASVGALRLYAITHEMKEVPREKSKRAVVDMQTDKKFTLRMLEDLGADTFREALRDALLMNGFSEGPKIRAFVGAVTRDLKQGSYVTIVYESDIQRTTITVQGAGTAVVDGLPFMRAAWSMWFGKSEQPALGDALLSRCFGG